MGIFLGDRRANLEDPAVPLDGSTLAEFFSGPMSEAGVRINERNAMQMSALWRGVTLLSSVSASLPLKTYKSGTRDEVASQLLADPHPELTAFELWRLSYLHRLLWGNFYAQKRRDGRGIRYLEPLYPSKVQVGRATDGTKVFGVTLDSGKQLGLTTNEIFHLPGLGYDGVCGVSPIRQGLAQAVGLAVAAETYGARLFSKGSLIGGVLQTDQRLDEPSANRLKAAWASKHAGNNVAHDIAVLDSGAKFAPTTFNPEDAQLLETRDFQVGEIARWLGLPPHMIGQVDKSTSWGTGIEQQAIGFVVWTLQPEWLTPTEQRITKELTGSGVYAKYKVQGLLRGDSAARAEFYNVMRNIGVLNPDEIRELEDLPPIPDGAGQSYLQPLNMAPLGADTGGQPNA